jgi:hypothetical protein
MKTYGCYNYPKMVVCYMGANVQKWPTSTSFHGVVIEKTLEGFVHCPYLYTNCILANESNANNFIK